MKTKAKLPSRREELWIWDIETSPLPEAELLEAMPESIQNPFMPLELSQPAIPNFAELAHGNIKDPDKLAAWRETKCTEWHVAHKAKVDKWNDDCMKARFKFIDEAALSPETGRVLAIGVKLLGDSAYTIMQSADEAELLSDFWQSVANIKAHSEHSKLVGFNTHKFDWRFVIARSWRHRIKTPRIMQGAYIDRSLSVDLMEDWQCGNRQEYISLARLARMLGVKKKEGSGELFYKLWEKDREAALAYLRNDLDVTEECAISMGYAP